MTPKLRMVYRWLAAVQLGMVVLIAFATAGAVAQVIQAQGTWTSTDGQTNGAWQAGFDPTGTDSTGMITSISGNVSLTGMPGLTQCTAAGSLQPGSIQFGIMYDSQERAVFTGTVSGNALNGTFTSPDGLNGNWQGQLTAKPGGSVAAPAATPTAAAP